jgi:hypothetical protein
MLNLIYARDVTDLAFSASMQGSNYSMQNHPCLVRQTSLMYAIYTVLTAIGGLIERGVNKTT